MRRAFGFNTEKEGRAMKGLVWKRCLFVLLCLVWFAAVPAAPQSKQSAGAAGGRVRTYFIAADEVEWDYVPIGIDVMTGKPFEGIAAAYTQSGANHIGHIYRKAIYREYTDAKFAKLKPRPARDEYLGLLGPILRAEVGDTIKVVFKNNGSRPYSMHPHGVFYQKASEGSMYADNVPEAQKKGDMTPPGATFTYEWEVPERAGPGPDDPSSVVWLYHSHVDEFKDVASGLIGTIIVTRRGQANPDGTPKGVDREIVALFAALNENQSWYEDQNIAAHISEEDRKKLDKVTPTVSDLQGNFTFAGTGFSETNYKFSVNGYLYGNGPVMTMKQGQHVRWYLVDMGDGVNFHSPHWHGNTVVYHGHRTDTIALMPAEMETADMIPDDPGLWLFHCHVDDHMLAGMTARYEVKR
jgi:FtsP/CotA-like multicopper oxidase with cupredoxin domain